MSPRLHIIITSAGNQYYTRTNSEFPWYEVSFEAFKELSVRGYETIVSIDTLRGQTRFEAFKWDAA